MTVPVDDAAVAAEVTDSPAQRLVFAEPRAAARRKPPQHLADLDQAGRRAAVQELGYPAFRADQLARHYFAGDDLADDGQLTDVPAKDRTALREALAPTLFTPTRVMATDDGATRKTLWRPTTGCRSRAC